MGGQPVRVKRRHANGRALLFAILGAVSLVSATGCGGDAGLEAGGQLTNLRREQWHYRRCLDFWMLAVGDPSGTQARETSTYWYRLAGVEKRILEAGGDPSKLVELPTQEGDMPIRWQADCAQMRLRVKQQSSAIEDAEHLSRWSGRVDPIASRRLEELRSLRSKLERLLSLCGCRLGEQDAMEAAQLSGRADELDRQSDLAAMDDTVQRGLPERGAPPAGR